MSLPPGTPVVQWRSTLKIGPSIELKAPDSVPWTEVWQLDPGPMWHVEPRGIPEVYQTAEQSPGRMRQWQPWPGEVVTVAVTRPQGISGPTLTIDSSRLEMSPGLRAADVTVTLEVRSSRGGQKSFVLPRQAELQSLTINGATQPIRQEGQTVTIPIVPGRQTIAIAWREPHGIGMRVVTPKFELGAPSVNAETIINMPVDRWTLFVAPALLGPAVLFWGLLLVFALIAFALGRSSATPLRTGHWFLLSLGLTQVPIWSAALVVRLVARLGMAQAARRVARMVPLQTASNRTRGLDGVRADESLRLDRGGSARSAANANQRQRFERGTSAMVPRPNGERAAADVGGLGAADGLSAGDVVVGLMARIRPVGVAELGMGMLQ